ncbi:MAG TPA: PAS domain-containing sensor histidine kinase [Gemmatimonadaceae bacterium]
MDAPTRAGTNGSALSRRPSRAAARTDRKDRDVAEHRYRRLFETSPNGILVLSASTGRILDANPFMLHLLGLPRDEMLGRQLREVGLLAEDQRRSGAVHQVADSGVVRWEERQVRSNAHPDGICVEIATIASREGNDEVIHCHVRHISERQRVESNATVHAEELDVVDRHKDEFLATLSHELRNAIAPVANALVVLRLAQEAESPIPNKARTLIERQVGHLTHLVDDLLEVSRTGASRMRLNLGMVDLRAVVQRSVEAVMSANAHRKHEVSVSLPAVPIWLNGDAMRLEQVVVNLVSNAASYTPDGGSITIRVRRSGERAELLVADSGMGIATDMLPLVFDLFTRSESARTQVRNGLGIGLNIVKRIVELHGGSVGAQSAGPAAGSEFLVSLPLGSPAA